MWQSSLLLCLILQHSEPSVQELLARIDALERRVEQLEAERKPPDELAREVPAAAQPVAASAASQDPVSHDPASHDAPPPPQRPPIPDLPVPPQYPSLELRGFSDIDFFASDQKGTHPGFSEGQFTLHMVSALAPKVSFFSELTLTARLDAGTGNPAAPGFNPEVERSIIRFDQSDALKVSFGRYHTPINWWNTAYHHGAWLQTTVSRPEMVMFGGRFIPIHFVGAQVEGTIPAGGLNLNYNAGLGNGRGPVLNRPGDAGDINNNKAWLGNINVRPNHAYGLQFGASVYQDRIDAAPGQNFREWITSGHVVWTRETPEIIAEVANATHKPLAGIASILPVSNSLAYYVQSGYRLPFASRAWKPYYRYEYIHIPRSDVAFRGVPNLTGSILGLRYDLTEFAALKFEYRNQRRPPDPVRVNSAYIQTSFTF
jgi:hypothetical protein